MLLRDITISKLRMRNFFIILWIIPIAIFIWIIDKHIVFSGKLTLEYIVSQDSKDFAGFASKEPYQLIGRPTRGGNEKAQLITTTPMYFDVHVPRPFEKATVSVVYQNPDNQPVIDLGVKQANSAYSFSRMAIQYSLFDAPPLGWRRIEEDGVVLLQKNTEYFDQYHESEKKKEKALADLAAERKSKLEEADNEYKLSQNSEAYVSTKDSIEKEYLASQQRIESESVVSIDPTWQVPYQSVDDFLSNPPPFDRVAVLDYDLPTDLKIAGYQQSEEKRKISSSLRGKHEIATYIGEGEILSFSFRIQSINRHAGEDVISLALKKGDQIITKQETVLHSPAVPGIPSEETVVDLSRQGLPEGRYTITISAPDDVFIKEIITSQKLLMLKGRIYLTDNDEYSTVVGKGPFSPTTLYTDSTAIIADTSHEKGFQTVNVNKRPLAITEKNADYRLEGLTGISNLSVPSNDLRIRGDGYFAFSREEMFDIPSDFDVFSEKSDPKDYDFIIGKYVSPIANGDWLVAETTVTVPELYTQNDIVSMFIDFPGLPENQRNMYVKSVKVELTKPPITPGKVFQKAKKWLSNIW